jgi:AcrR family transcriptional regulator
MSTKDKIMVAAKKLFFEKGYHATSLRDLAKEIGATTSIIYYYFKNKEELLVRIYEGLFEESIDGLSKIAQSNMPTIEKMAEIIKYHGKFIMVGQPLAKIIFVEESLLPNDYQKLIRDKKRIYNKIIEDTYANGVKEGVFKPSLDLKVFVRAIIGMGNWAYKWYEPNKGDDPEKICQEFVDILTEGYLISKKKGFNQEKEGIAPSPEIVDLSNVDRKLEEIMSKIQILTSTIELLTEKSEGIHRF